MAALAPSLWSRRLHDADADALRYRLLAAQLRPRQSQIRALRERVLAALSDEAAALDALEAAAERRKKEIERFAENEVFIFPFRLILLAPIHFN